MTALAAALLAAAAAAVLKPPGRRVGRVLGAYPTERSGAADRPALPRSVAPPPRRFVHRRRDPHAADLPPALALDLVAAVLDAGAPPGAAMGLVADAVAAAGGSPAGEVVGGLAAAAAGADGRAGRDTEEPAPGRLAVLLRDLTTLSVQTGLPLADLVRAAAEDQRRERASAQAVAVRRLAVLLVLPTGLCLLPAFLLLGVVPLVIDLITAT